MVAPARETGPVPSADPTDPAGRRERAGAPPLPAWDLLRGLAQELPRLLGDRLELLSLELQRAGIALAVIAMLAVACGVLAVTAWLLLWSGLVLGLVALGLHPAWALAAAVVLNLLAVALAWRHARAQLPLLRLPATRRHLGRGSVDRAAAADARADPGESRAPPAAASPNRPPDGPPSGPPPTRATASAPDRPAPADHAASR